MKRTLIAATVAALVPASAFAYVILERDPGPGPGPIRWQFTGGTIEYRHNLLNAPAGIDGPDLVDQAFDTWTGVPSATIAFSRGADTTAAGFDFGDGINTVAWEDPDDELEVGVLAAAASHVPNGTTHGFNSTTFYAITQADIVMNDGVTWTDSDGASLLGGCIANKYDTEAVALHEIGHFLGLGHPPKSQGYASAVMYPAIADCDASRTSPKADDVNGVTFLYDSGIPPVYPAFGIDEDVGYAPHTVVFSDQTVGAVTSHLWEFGDGGTASTANASHQYGVPGLYDVTLTVNGTAALERIDAITVIQRPDVEFSADVLEGDAPLTVTFTDLSDDVGPDPRYRWRIDGDLVSSDVGDFAFTFEDGGTYTIALQIDAGAGFVEEEKAGYIVVAGEEEEEIFPGCSCRVADRGRAPLAPLGLAGLVMFLFRRRSR